MVRNQDLRDEWKRKRQESTDVTDDVVFEIELIRQIEINIDYILMLVKKYHDTHCEDKEVLITINKAIDASPELRSKKQLIETFIAGINDVDDVMNEWHEYVVEQREHDLNGIITTEKLRPEDTRKFIENAFRDGEIKTTGTDIDKLMPPISRFTVSLSGLVVLPFFTGDELGWSNSESSGKLFIFKFKYLFYSLILIRIIIIEVLLGL